MTSCPIPRPGVITHAGLRRLGANVHLFQQIQGVKHLH